MGRLKTCTSQDMHPRLDTPLYWDMLMHPRVETPQCRYRRLISQLRDRDEIIILINAACKDTHCSHGTACQPHRPARTRSALQPCAHALRAPALRTRALRSGPARMHIGTRAALCSARARLGSRTCSARARLAHSARLALGSAHSARATRATGRGCVSVGARQTAHTQTAG